jgi:hypothetical protein
MLEIALAGFESFGAKYMVAEAEIELAHTMLLAARFELAATHLTNALRIAQAADQKKQLYEIYLLFAQLYALHSGEKSEAHYTALAEQTRAQLPPPPSDEIVAELLELLQDYLPAS